MCTISPSMYLYARVCMPRGPAPPTMAHPQVVLVGRVLTYLVRIYRSPCYSIRPGWQQGPLLVASGTAPICRDLPWVSVE